MRDRPDERGGARARRPRAWPSGSTSRRSRARRWRSSGGSSDHATSTRPRPRSPAPTRSPTQHGLTVWRVRALHELGTIDLLRGGGVDRLEQARALALALGALATVAVLDVQIAAALAFGDDPEPSLAVARRAAELAQAVPARPAPLAAALRVRGRRPRPGAAGGPSWSGAWPRRCEHGDRDFDGHRRVRAGPARVRGGGPSRRPRGHLERAAVSLSAGVRRPGHRTGGGDAGARARGRRRRRRHGSLARARAGALPGARLTPRTPRPCWPAGPATSTRRCGCSPRATRRLAGASWFRHYGRRLVAEAALADGWGEPGGVAPDALAVLRRATATTGSRRRAGRCCGRRARPVPRRRASEAASSARCGRWASPPGSSRCSACSARGCRTRRSVPACTCRPARSSATSPTSRPRPAWSDARELVAFAARTRRP